MLASNHCPLGLCGLCPSSLFARPIPDGNGVFCPGADGQAHAGDAALCVAVVGLLAAGADDAWCGGKSEQTLGWQLYCHPRGDSATIAPTNFFDSAPTNFFDSRASGNGEGSLAGAGSRLLCGDALGTEWSHCGR